MEVRDLFSQIWKRRAIVLFVLLLTTGISAALAFTRSATYESTATIALTPDTRRDQGFVGSDTLSSLLRTYARTARSSTTRDRARRLYGGPLPGTVRTEPEEGAGILRIIGRDTDPEGAAETASATAQAFSESIQGNGLLIARTVDPPVAASQPVQPRPPLIIGVGALLGLIGGVMLAYALEHFRRRVETPADVAALTPAPIIGRLSRHRVLSRRSAQLIWDSSRLAALQEGFRALRTNIEFLTKDSRSVIQITSPSAAQGKSTIVANLGIAFAQVGVDTLIVDADLRRPIQHKIFDIPNDRGLSTLMALPDSGVGPIPTGVPNLSLLPSGPVPPNSTELLHIRFGGVIEDLDPEALLLVDSPPLLPVSDARLIAPHANGVIMVVAAGTQKPSALQSALEKLDIAGASLLGVVLNQVGYDADESSSYYYSYEGLPADSSPLQEPPKSPPLPLR